MSVAQKALLTAAFAILNIVIGIFLTTLFVPLPQALALWLLALAVVVVAALFWPLRFGALVASPDPTAEPAAALARFRTSAVDGAAALNPLCRPTLLDHGRRTPKAVILLHGISNCPHTYVRLGAMLHARGHSVVMPRMPQNGHADRNTDALRRLTAEQLATYGDAAVDVAAGLADEVVVCGISAGGTVAAWIGQNRPVSRVVLVAPFLGLSNFGSTLNMLLMRIMLLLPHISIWKDPIKRDKLDAKPHGYNRQSTRGTGEVMRLGFATHGQARDGAPATTSAVLLSNANDTAVDNAMARDLLQTWKRHGIAVAHYEFPAELGFGHEIIDPTEPGIDPGVTYPVLVDLIEGTTPTIPAKPL